MDIKPVPSATQPDATSADDHASTGVAGARAQIAFNLNFHKADGSIESVPCTGNIKPEIEK